MCSPRDRMGGEEWGPEKISSGNGPSGQPRRLAPEQEGRFHRASRRPELSPEAKDCDDNNHQDQHHTHDRSACNQGQLLPPALLFWGRKAMIRKT